MNIKTEKHINDYDRDETNGPGESSINGNMYFDLQGAMPSQKVEFRAILDRYYKEICTALKNGVH